MFSRRPPHSPGIGTPKLEPKNRQINIAIYSNLVKFSIFFPCCLKRNALLYLKQCKYSENVFRAKLENKKIKKMINYTVINCILVICKILLLKRIKY